MCTYVLNLYEHEYYYFCAVDDVSAQCIISPNLDSLTIADGLTRDVEFHCRCMNSDGMIMWFHNGSSLPTQNAITSSVTAPYQINTTPITLYINAPFTTDRSLTGTYTCSPNSTFPTIPPGDAITLDAESKYVAMCVYCYYLADSDTIIHTQPV